MGKKNRYQCWHYRIDPNKLLLNSLVERAVLQAWAKTTGFELFGHHRQGYMSPFSPQTASGAPKFTQNCLYQWLHAVVTYKMMPPWFCSTWWIKLAHLSSSSLDWCEALAICQAHCSPLTHDETCKRKQLTVQISHHNLAIESHNVR